MKLGANSAVALLAAVMTISSGSARFVQRPFSFAPGFRAQLGIKSGDTDNNLAKETAPDHSGVSHHLSKRDFFNCWNVEDCEGLIEDMRAQREQFTVPSGLCLIWYHGTCKAKLCAKDGADMYGFNATSDWIADSLTDPLLEECASKGNSGTRGDCANLNGGCETYRLYLEMTL